MEIIHFKNVENILLVSGCADGVKGLFAFDTGAMQTALNKKYFSDFDGKNAEVAIFDSSEAVAAAAQVRIREFSVGNIVAHDVTALLLDMSYVEDELRKVDPSVAFYGSVNMDIFGNSPILLDYERSEITVEPDIDKSEAEKIPIYAGALPVITLKIGGEEHKFVLDTGANTCLLSSDLADKIFVKPSEEAEGLYVIPKIDVGSREYNDIEAVFTDISHIRAAVETDGVIGGQILSKQRSVIDIAGGALYLF